MRLVSFLAVSKQADKFWYVYNILKGPIMVAKEEVFETTIFWFVESVEFKRKCSISSQ